MNERELRTPVHEWLSPNGNTRVIYEFLFSGYCDMVGVLFADQVGRRIPPVIKATAIELKLTDVAGVIRQAKSNRHYVHASYAAMPRWRVQKMRPDTVEKFVDAGVGLLSVGADVDVVIEPGPPLSNGSSDRLRKRWWSRIVRDDRLRRQTCGSHEPNEPEEMNR